MFTYLLSFFLMTSCLSADLSVTSAVCRSPHYVRIMDYSEAQIKLQVEISSSQARKLSFD